MLTEHVKANNEVLRKWLPDEALPSREICLSHHEVLTRIDGYDPERGQKIVGHRGYCLTGCGLFLNDALLNYGKQFLHKRGYTAIQPPFFMFRDYMAKTAQLEQFDEELYKVVENEGKPDTDKYLIATSEQPISALHAGEWLQAKELPIKSVASDDIQITMAHSVSGMLGPARALEKRQEPTARMHGVSSGFTNSKRWRII